MTLSQRLTRAGLSFIVFGTAVSLMPTDGMAFSASDSCPPPTIHDYVGTQDATSAYFIGHGSTSTILTAYPVSGVTVTGVSNTSVGFLNTVLGDSVLGYSVTSVDTSFPATVNAVDNVVVSFSDGRTVSYTVTQN